MNILADANLPGLFEAFPPPFQLTVYQDQQEIPDLLVDQDVLLCRSTLKNTTELLSQQAIKFLATASSGTDHLDYPFLKTKKIQVIDAKGCNASAVADYVLACLAYLDQEQLLFGKQVGIIGMGMVGVQVASRLKAADFQLYCFDPLKAAATEFSSCTQEDLYQCDILCIHPELHHQRSYPSFNLIDAQFLQLLKSHCVLINAARGSIVNETDLLQHKSSLIYCTDVYSNEPKVSQAIINKATLCTPHIAGHSVEAKYKAVTVVSVKLHQLLGLPVPNFKRVVGKQLSFQEDDTWQKLALAAYNPIVETHQLKQADNTESTFLSLRKNHRRHDFSVYYQGIQDRQLQQMMGIL